jgi:hypothetical protein
MEELRDASVTPADADGKHNEATANDSALPRRNRKPSPPLEVGGRRGPDPTRFGDWEIGGRCIDF